MGNPEETLEDPLLEEYGKKKGGLRVVPYIIVSIALYNMATLGMRANISLYLMNEYKMEMKSATNIMFAWSSISGIMPLLGAILADSLLGRFYTIGFGFLVSIMGMILIWMSAIIPEARPLSCDQSGGICDGSTVWQLMYLFFSFGLLSIGSGAADSCFLAFAVDQLQQNGETKSRLDKKEKLFAFYYAAVASSALMSLMFISYIQEKLGWGMEFAVCTLLILCGGFSFVLSSSSYIKVKSKSSLLTGLAQAAVASFKNRHLKLSDGALHTFYSKKITAPSRRLRCLNKACVIRTSEDLTPTGEPRDPWSLCTVDQVEELKALIRIIPIWSAALIWSIDMNQSTFQLVQASVMDRHINSSFLIPAASFNMFIVIAAIVWIVVINRIYMPLASRLRGSQVHITSKTKMGTGIALSFLQMLVSSLVEATRRYLAHRDGFLDVLQSPVMMSALWLIPQYCLNGFSQASTEIGQIEFYFSEFPQSMASFASSLSGIGTAIGSLASSFIVNTVDKVTKAGGKESWISTDINKGHYDYYYLVLAGLSAANAVYFLVCSTAYGPLKAEQQAAEEEEFESTSLIQSTYASEL